MHAALIRSHWLSIADIQRPLRSQRMPAWARRSCTACRLCSAPGCRTVAITGVHHQPSAYRAGQRKHRCNQRHDSKAADERLLESLLKQVALRRFDRARRCRFGQLGNLGSHQCTPSTAAASIPATRAVALLMPDATPAWLSSTARMTLVASGATLTAIPRPSTAMGGKNVVQYDPPLSGTASNANPTAVIVGPTVSSLRAPYRSMSPPDHRDNAHDHAEWQERRAGERRRSSPALGSS